MLGTPRVLDRILSFIMISSRSTTTSGVVCDTFKIRKTRTVGKQTSAVSRVAWKYDKETMTCQICPTLNRQCTFTYVTSLVEAWVGGLVYDETKYHEKEGRTHFIPMVGKGRMATMLPHTVFNGQSFPVEEASAPWGWRYLYNGAEDDAQEDEEVAVKVEEVEGDGEE